MLNSQVYPESDSAKITAPNIKVNSLESNVKNSQYVDKQDEKLEKIL